MSSLRLKDILIVTASIMVSVKGAPVATDTAGELPNNQLQKSSLTQPHHEDNRLPSSTEMTTAPAYVSDPTPMPRGKPSQTFVKTVLRGFFDDLKKRPRLVDDLIRHEAYKEMLSEPLAVMEPLQLEPQLDAQLTSKTQPQVRPLVAPVLTLVPVLLNPGTEAGENQDQGVLMPPQESLSVPELEDSKGETDITGDVEQQKLPKSSGGESLQTPSQSQPQLAAEAYSGPQVPVRNTKIENPQEEKYMVPAAQQEDPHYIYSIIPVQSEIETKQERLGTKKERSEEAPAYYYYVYYDDDDATEGDKKNPTLEDYPVPVAPEIGNSFEDSLHKAEEGQPKLTQPKEAAATDTQSAQGNREHIPFETVESAKLANMASSPEEKIGEAKMDAVPGNSDSQKAAVPEGVSEENDLETLNH